MKMFGIKYVLLFLIVFNLTKCSKENTTTIDSETLGKLLVEIQELSDSMDCDDASKWRFTALGAKPCGGPVQYIAYSIEIDTVLFLNKVRDYSEMQRKFNEETGAVSDCAVTEVPEEVICKDRKPVFSYRLE